MESLSSLARVFRGTIVHTRSKTNLEILCDHVVGIDKSGCISFVKPDGEVQIPQEIPVVDLGKRFLLPGFVDTHAHAPQYVFAGTGMDLELLPWLDTYTFPAEAAFNETEHAVHVYEKSVRGHLRRGTTTVCYFATIHLEASKMLCDLLKMVGMRAFVGKVNMDRNSKDYYVEDTAASLRDTRSFVEHVQQSCGTGRDALVQPIITPRFVPTCTPDLMAGLGEIAQVEINVEVLWLTGARGARETRLMRTMATQEHGLRIQSHLSENEGECAWVKELHPDVDSYSEVYDRFGLFNDRTIMAHAIYLSDREIDLVHQRGVAIAHCPNSNFSLSSGVLNARRLLDAGVKLGLGSDVAGGYSPSMLDALRFAITASKCIHFNDRDSKPLSYAEALYLATLGGAEALGIADLVGSFEPGKRFDALVVDPDAEGGPFDTFSSDKESDVLQKFLFLGDDRNITQIWINGTDVTAHTR